MHLYHHTLQAPTAITAAIYGNFSAPKVNEIIVAKGSTLELLRPDEGGTLQTIASVDVFGLILSLAPLRLMEQTTDHIVVGSDSGNTAILRFNAETNEFKKVCLEPFGKSGVRRITPGQYIAREPNGRAIMIAAVEKQKFVYTVTRDSNNEIHISSPLEAHCANSIVYDVVGLDNGFENPFFACLEVDYSEVDSDPTGVAAQNVAKQLVYYELDLGINHVVRKWSRETDHSAHRLIPVPGGVDGPGGVLILTENFVLYDHSARSGPLRIPIPRRADHPDSKSQMIISYAVYKSKSALFFLLQSESGDLFKVTLTIDTAKNLVTDVILKYFDTIPPSKSLLITRSGLLFVAAEFGNHLFYQLSSLGDGDDTVESRAIVASSGVVDVTVPVFVPRVLTNLSKLDEQENHSALTCLRAISASADAQALVAAGHSLLSAEAVNRSSSRLLLTSGRGPRSALKLLKPGLAVTELALSPLAASPNAVFAIRAPTLSLEEAETAPHSHLLLSFENSSVVLALTDSVDEVPADSLGLFGDRQTLLVGQMGPNIVQVLSNCIRVVRMNVESRTPETTKTMVPPGHKNITAACMNSRQLLLGVAGGAIHLFELDDSGALTYTASTEISNEVMCLSVAPVPPTRVRAPLAVLADSSNTVRVLGLDPQRRLRQTSAQALRESADSILLSSLGTPGGPLTLFVALKNGVLTRISLDPASGMLSDPRVSFVGTRRARGGRGVALGRAQVAGAPAVLVLSARSFMIQAAPFTGASTPTVPPRFITRPLVYESMQGAVGVNSPALPEAVIAVSGPSMRVLQLPAVAGPAGSNAFASRAISLDRTPRAVDFVKTPLLSTPGSPTPSTPSTPYSPLTTELDPQLCVVVESDCASYTDAQQQEVASLVAATHGIESLYERVVDGEDAQAERRDPMRVGVSLSTQRTQWASTVSLVDLGVLGGESNASVRASESRGLASRSTLFTLALPSGVGAFSVCSLRFHDYAPPTSALADAERKENLEEVGEHVIVGCAKDLDPLTGQGEFFLNTYRIVKRFGPTSSDDPAAAAAAAPSGTQLEGGVRLELEFLHSTPVEGVPRAMVPLLGRLLVGVGSTLRLYDLGKRRLLRKSELTELPTQVASLQTSYDRVFVGDAQDSVLFCRYRANENEFVVFADDVIPRHVTALCPLDHDTIAVGDKFGSVALLRLPGTASDDSIVASSAGGSGDSNMKLWLGSGSRLGGAPHKALVVAAMHVGSTVMSLQKATFTIGGAEVLLYATVNGSIGMFLPFLVKEDILFFSRLEALMRGEDLSLIGRSHMMYRGSMEPVANTVDGDLCDVFMGLKSNRQKAIAKALDRTVQEVYKKLEDVKNRFI